MSEQELKRLKRSEILEIMVEQSKAVKTMRAETDQMKEQLEDYRERVKEQNETITRLRAGIVSGSAESEEESRQLDLVYKQIEEKIRSQRARIKELEAEVVRLKKELKAKSEAAGTEQVSASEAANPEQVFKHAATEPKPVFRTPVKEPGQRLSEQERYASETASSETAVDSTLQMDMLLNDARRAADALSRRVSRRRISEGGYDE